MNKTFSPLLVLTLVITGFMPSVARADDYGGPSCWEDPRQWASYTDDPSSIRGTCKLVKYSSNVSLDAALQEEYILGLHRPVGIACERGGCSQESKASEIITLSKNGTIEFNDYANSQDSNHTIAGGDLEVLREDEKGSLWYFDRLVLVKKEPTSSLVEDAYTQARATSSREYLELYVLDLEEMRKLLKTPLPSGWVMPSGTTYESIEGYTFEELEGLFDQGKKNYVYSSQFPLRRNDPTIYILGSYFAPYVSSFKNPFGANSIVESTYFNIDQTALPPSLESVGVTRDQGRRTTYITSLTNPINTMREYWTIRNKDGKITLAWNKTEYELDDGTTKTVTRDGKSSITPTTAPGAETKVNGSDAQTTQPDVQEDAAVEIPLEKPGFFTGIWSWILSWFK